MPKDSNASASLAVLRAVREWSQRQLAEAAGVRPSSISDWERGKKTPSPRTLERLAGAMGFSPAIVQRALAFVGDARADSGPAVPGDLAQQVRALANEFGREVTDFVEAGLTRLTLESTAIHERSRAPFLWSRLKTYGAAERRAIVQECEEFRSWGLCELLCEESVKAAADNPDRAVELADLALRIAGRVPGEERWRSQVQGYAWAFVPTRGGLGAISPAPMRRSPARLSYGGSLLRRGFLTSRVC
jgi:transcriptional regulator with XRE-family HTH domain